MCVFFVCFLFFETTREKSFFSLVVDLCVVGLPHTKVFVSCFVSFLFFFFAPDEKDDDQKKRDTKREYEMIRVW